MSLISFINWSRIQGSKDDDWADRVSHLWTVGLLAMFTLLVSSALYVGDPIQCWASAKYSDSEVSYIKSVCWISNTYVSPHDQPLIHDRAERKDKEISYYQWVPIILMFQALMFKLPNLLWRLLNGVGGLNMDSLVQLTESTQLGTVEDREKVTNQAAKYIDKWLKAHRQYHNNALVRVRQIFSNIFCFWFAKRDGKYLSGLYLFVKGIYAANIIGQFFLLNSFMSMDFSVYGFEVLYKVFNGEEFKDSLRFPRVTLCDFEIRQFANIQSNTVQCVLPINLFNEKIFIFLWFWFFLVAVVSCSSYLFHLYYFIFDHNRYKYVKKYLKITDNLRNENDLESAKKFANEYLLEDGVFVLRVIAKNSSELVLTDIISCLWALYQENPPKIKQVNKRHTEMKMNGDMFSITQERDLDDSAIDRFTHNSKV
jgi:hypothetical protein